MNSLLTNTQATWLDKLYEANSNSQAAGAVPAGVFKALETLGHVTGTAEAAHISPHGAGYIVQARIAKVEQERKAKKTSKKRKGKRSCSRNSSKNTDQDTSNSPQFAW